MQKYPDTCGRGPKRSSFPIVSDNELIVFDSLEDIEQYKNDAFSNENGVVWTGPRCDVSVFEGLRFRRPH